MASDTEAELGSPVGHLLPSLHLGDLRLCSRQRTLEEGEPVLPPRRSGPTDRSSLTKMGALSGERYVRVKGSKYAERGALYKLTYEKR